MHFLILVFDYNELPGLKITGKKEPTFLPQESSGASHHQLGWV